MRKTQSRQQEGDRARQDDGAKAAPVAGAEAGRDLEQARIGGADRRMRVDGDRQHGEQKDDEHAGAEPGADPDHDQWQEGHLRRGVERGQERCGGIGEAAIPTGGEAERNADRDRQCDAEHVADAARREIAPDFAGHEEHAPGSGGDQRRRGDEDRLDLPAIGGAAEQWTEQIRPPAALAAFPSDQYQYHHQCAENGALVRVVAAPQHARGRFGGGSRVHRGASGRQRSKRRSSRSSSATTTSPVAMKIATPKNTTSVAKVLPASAIMCPMPAVEA